MGWSETHRRWQVLRELESALGGPAAGALPWNEEYAELFGTPEALVAMLRYRWDIAREAQVDPSLPEAVLDEQRQRLTERFAGVRRLLARYDTGRGAGEVGHVAA